MKIVFQIRDALDRRTAEQQNAADALLENEWRRRVARNPKERARLIREEMEARPACLKAQAS